jgi:hypothetical protein
VLACTCRLRRPSMSSTQASASVSMPNLAAWAVASAWMQQEPVLAPFRSSPASNISKLPCHRQCSCLVPSNRPRFPTTSGLLHGRRRQSTSTRRAPWGACTMPTDIYARFYFCR